jgi:hypothetical protein
MQLFRYGGASRAQQEKPNQHGGDQPFAKISFHDNSIADLSALVKRITAQPLVNIEKT